MTGFARTLSARNARNGAPLGDRIATADRMLSRMRGLLARPELRPGEGLLITPCSGIHTWFMGYGIDVAFVDKSGRIVGIRRCIRPFRLVPHVRGAHRALELPCGTLERADVTIGDLIEFDEAQESAA